MGSGPSAKGAALPGRPPGSVLAACQADELWSPVPRGGPPAFRDPARPGRLSFRIDYGPFLCDEFDKVTGEVFKGLAVLLVC